MKYPKKKVFNAIRRLKDFMQITQLQYAKTSNRFLFARKFDGNFDYIGIIDRKAFFE